MSMDKNRRRNYRLEIELPVVCTVLGADEGDSFHATSFDLSAGGTALVTEQALELDTRLLLEMAFEDPPFELRVEGDVVHRQGREGRIQYGIMFRGLDPAEQTRITKFVFAEAKRRGIGSAPARVETKKRAERSQATLESLLREEDIPNREAPRTFVDAVIAATVQDILEGNAAIGRRYPETEEMLSYYVDQRARQILRERAGRSG
jgi:hypothetical protein